MTTKKIYLFITAGIIAVGCLAHFVVYRFGAPGQAVPDTPLRAKLLARKKTGPAGTPEQRVCYSPAIYDMEIADDFSGPLMWADNVPADPTGRFSFQWRIKVSAPGRFAVTNTAHDAVFSVDMVAADGLPVFFMAENTALPAPAVALAAGIYVVNVMSSRPLNTICFNFTRLRGSPPDSAQTPAGTSVKKLYLQLDGSALKELRRIKELCQLSPSGIIGRMPRGRARGSLSDERGSRRIKVRIGLSGRTAEHLKGFPSVDLSVERGNAFRGLTSFKLYRMETKSGLMDLVFLSVLRDMGFPVPRQEVCDLVVNGEDQGIYVLMETPSPAMFAAVRKAEGNIVGADIDKLFFNYPLSARIEAKYFYEAGDHDDGGINTRFFLSEDFTKKLDPHFFARYLAFSSLYFAAHGLGIDDLRFYQDPSTGSFYPIPRDLNPGSWQGPCFGGYNPNVAWLKNQPYYTVWPVRRLQDSRYRFGNPGQALFAATPTMTGIADLHVAVPNFLTDPEHLLLTNKYLLYFADDTALYQKLYARTINTLTDVLREHYDRALHGQLLYVQARKIPSYGVRAHHEIERGPAYFKEDTGFFCWNNRASIKLDPKLMPSFISPLRERLHEVAYKRQMALSFLCERKIFSLLEKNNFSLSVKTFAQVLPEAVSGDVVDLALAEEDDALAEQKKMEVPNVVMFLGTCFPDKENALVLFLVRNVSGDLDFRLVPRDGLADRAPVVNEHFTLVDGARRQTSSLEEIAKNHFSKGEELQLLAFLVKRDKEAVFYHLTVPAGSYFLFPPYMYVPPYSVDEDREAGADAQETFSGLFRRDGAYHIMPRTTVRVESDMNLPENAALIVHEGATIVFSEQASLRVNGDLFVLGTEDAPVRFVSEGPAPWGGLYAGRSFALKSNVVLKNVVFDNFGAWPKTRVTDLFENGGITFYNADVDMYNVSITRAGSEDAINLIHSRGQAENVRVSGAYSDAMDLDFSFVRLDAFAARGSGGDALDLSSSLVVCDHARLEDNADKGISVGEASNAFILHSVLSGNNFGIANKDQSALYVENTSFEHNEIGIAEFIKKFYFGKPVMTEKDSIYDDNTTDHKWLGFYHY